MVTDMIAERFMRLPDVEHQIGFRRSKIYALMQDNAFPAPIKIGRTSLWLRSEVTGWMDARIADAMRLR